MTVIDYQEKPDSPTYQETDSGERTYVRTFWVTCNSRNDGPLVAVTAPIIPGRGFVYAFRSTDVDAQAICRSLSAKPDTLTPSGRRFEITATYSTKASDPQDQQNNPTDRPPDIAYSFQNFSRPIAKDKDGTAIKNTAGDPFLEPIEREDGHLVLVYEGNQVVYDAAQAIEFVNAVNSTDWNGGQPRTWKCNQIAGSQQFENGFTFYKVRYEFQYKPDKWDKKILSTGLRKKVGANLVKIQDPELNHAITVPTFLNQAGTDVIGPTGTPYEQTFRVYPEKDFNSLPLEM